MAPKKHERLHGGADRSGEAHLMKPAEDYSTIGDYAIAAALVGAFFMSPHWLAALFRFLGVA